MHPDILHIAYKAQFSAIFDDPNTVPSLCQLGVQAFVRELDRTCKLDVRIPVLPIKVLKGVLKEMSCYPSLRRKLHQELSDPVVFMKMFTDCRADRLVLEHCLREASSIGESVLPDLAKNWCKMVSENELKSDSSAVPNKIAEAMEFGTYLHDAGWASQSKNVLDVALRMLAQLKEDRNNKTMKIICMQKLLRAEGSAMMLSKADTTCSTLLTMIEGISDNDILIAVFLEVAQHNRRAERFTELHNWTRKGMELMTVSTPVEHVLKILQLEAVYLSLSRRYESAGLFINQAIHRARSTFGELHLQYANTLYTHGVYLLKKNAISCAIPVLLELLDIITKLYGTYTPHVVKIRIFLAYGYYRRTRYDIAYSHIQTAIILAKQVMPEYHKVIDHFCKLRGMILRGYEGAQAAVRENGAVSGDDFQLLDVAELKHKWFELHGELNV